jgi:hypothetical protein
VATIYLGYADGENLWPGKAVLELADGYSGNLATLRSRFTLKGFVDYSELDGTFSILPITGYEIGANGTLTSTLPPLTGTVTISGTAEEGQSLTANTSGINGNGTLSYQWKRGGVNITGATSANYTLTAADGGSYITVAVSCQGYSGSVTSAQAGPVKPLLTGTVTINGTAVQGQILTADTGSLNGTGTLSYQWKRGGADISGATGVSYTLTTADVGYSMSVTVSRADCIGNVSSTGTGAVLALLTGTVTISGTAGEGQSLTADISGLNGNGTPSYQWKRGGADISGATEENYTLTTADVGSYITVAVSRQGYGGSVISTPAGPVIPLLTGTVTISGTATVGQTLTANTSGLNGTGTLSYQWKRGGVDISGETGVSYTLTATDSETLISVTVSRAGYSGSRSSSALTVKNPAGVTLVYPDVPGDPAEEALSSFTISRTGIGTPATHSLTVQGNFDSYQWQVDSVEKTADAGSAGKTLTLDALDYLAGPHSISLEVLLQGLPYSETITFTVEN